MNEEDVLFGMELMKNVVIATLREELPKKGPGDVVGYKEIVSEKIIFDLLRRLNQTQSTKIFKEYKEKYL